MNRYREIEVAGTPRELGRQIGEAAGDEIRAFREAALHMVGKTVRVSRATVDYIVAQSLLRAEQYGPHMVEELRGMAEAARVTVEDVTLLQVRNQLQPDADAGCTSFSLATHGAAHGGHIVGQNWDNDPDLQPFTVVLTRRPIGKPAMMTVTQAGLIAYIGFNSAGIGVCLNTLPAPARPLGVPHYFTVRGIYEADSLEGAVHAVQRAERAIPANIMLATPQGPADLEVTLDQVHVLTDDGSGGVTHTNHCRHPALQEINGRHAELIQSHGRQQRIDQLLSSTQNRPDLPALKEALRDHDGYPRSICRHPNDDRATGFWQTVFSVIIEPQQRQMHISRGNPCEQPYETYTLR
ncbi:MAG: C45 family autoproteolytic acyltransferase/hydrolase [Pirellulales bacterium]